MHAPCSVTRYCGRRGLSAVASAWNELETLGEPAFYQQRRWYEAYLEFLEPRPDSASIYLVSRGDVPLAVVPLKSFDRRAGVLGPKILSTPVHPHLGLADALMRNGEDPAEIVDALLRHIARGDEPWDRLGFLQVPEGGGLDGGLRAVTGVPETASHVRNSNWLPLNGGYDTVMGRLAGPFRRNLRRLARRAGREGRVEYLSAQRPEELGEALERLLAVEASGWKGTAGTRTAIACHEELSGFYARLAETFGATEDCVINLLTLDGVCIAGQFCLRSNGVINLLKIGYHPHYRHVAPGHLLMEQVLKDFSERPDTRALSFVTDTRWQSIWRPHARRVFDHRIFNTTWRGRSDRVWQSARPWLHAIVRAVRPTRNPESGEEVPGREMVMRT